MNNTANYYDYIYKILLLGDSAVGKTCLLLRYSDDCFTENHISTIGLDYRLKMITTENDKIIKMQIWDTAGQDRFRSITKNYYKGAHGIILMFDVTNPSSFINIKNWLMQIKENTSEKVKIVIVGNKIDDESQRKINIDEAKKLSDENNLEYFETSAKNNIGIVETFNYITNEIFKINNGKDLDNHDKTNKKENITIDRKNDKLSKKEKLKKCCQK
jgi:Ras-related protein Rab-1A